MMKKFGKVHADNKKIYSFIDKMRAMANYKDCLKSVNSQKFHFKLVSKNIIVGNKLNSTYSKIWKGSNTNKEDGLDNTQKPLKL